METLTKYFDLTDEQLHRFEALLPLYADWNARINVISRKDTEFYTHHVLHSLAIARFVSFKPGSRIMDLGTGGGFPGIPLAIMFPESSFTLVDSIAKKLKVVADVADRLGLPNVSIINSRAESIKEDFDFVVSRAVAPLPTLYNWVRERISPRMNNPIANGIICLKGGDLEEELEKFRDRAEVVPIGNFFSEDYFETKKVVYLPKF